MKKIEPKVLFSDKRGSIENISVGRAFREVNKFTSKPGAKRGGHYHKETEEILFLISGRIKVDCENVKTGKKDSIEVAANEGVLLMPFEKHWAEILEDTVWISLLTKEYDNKNPDVFE